MITRNFARVNGSHAFQSEITDVSFQGALKEILDCELAFGCDVTELEADRFTLVTRVMNCTDTTTFSGSGAEFTKLVRLIVLYLYALQHAIDPLVLPELTKKVVHVSGGLPLHVCNVSMLILGESLTKVAVIAWLMELYGNPAESLIKFDPGFVRQVCIESVGDNRSGEWMHSLLA